MSDAKIKFQLEGQEPATIDKIGMGDMVAFERQYDLPATVLSPETRDKIDERTGQVIIGPDGEPEKEIVSNYRLEWMAFMVWRSARRQGLISKDVPWSQDFVDEIESFEVDKVADAVAGVTNADPQEPGQ